MLREALENELRDILIDYDAYQIIEALEAILGEETLRETLTELDWV